jgi:hypothetical protein
MKAVIKLALLSKNGPSRHKKVLAIITNYLICNAYFVELGDLNPRPVVQCSQRSSRASKAGLAGEGLKKA